MKRLLMAIVLLLGLFTVPALAVDAPYEFVSIEYNDRELAATDIVEVVAGESVSFETFLLSSGDREDVKIRAYINGYEYDDIEDRTGAFDVKPATTYKNVMTLDIPEDMEPGFYVVAFEAYDKFDEVQEEVTLVVVVPEHQLKFQDVDADSSVDAGEELEVYVRLENAGRSKEEDIKVTVSIPELGISEKGYIDELVADEEGLTDDDEETSGAITLALDIPAETPSGEYDVEVEVVYENGYSTAVEVFTITVDGVDTEADADVDAEATTVVVVVAEDTDAAVEDAAEPVDSITISTNALKIGFGVLAALLVVVAIVFILRRE